jgi:hypothetical protein
MKSKSTSILGTHPKRCEKYLLPGAPCYVGDMYHCGCDKSIISFLSFGIFNRLMYRKSFAQLSTECHLNPLMINDFSVTYLFTFLFGCPSYGAQLFMLRHGNFLNAPFLLSKKEHFGLPLTP